MGLFLLRDLGPALEALNAKAMGQAGGGEVGLGH